MSLAGILLRRRTRWKQHECNAAAHRCVRPLLQLPRLLAQPCPARTSS